MEIKHRILTKAEEMSRQLGFRAITMDDLAAQLGISKKTIYQYYKDKNELVDDIVTQLLTKSEWQCIETAKKADNAVDEIFKAMQQIRVDMHNLSPIILHDLMKYFPETYKKFLIYKSDFMLPLIEKNLAKGKEEGFYRQDIDIEVMSKFRVETMLLAFNKHLFPAEKYSLVAVTNTLLEHFVLGIATIKGLQLIEQYKLKQ